MDPILSLVDAIILGIVQGLTEFLPVSSSGHLVLAEAILGTPPGDITFEIVVHIASLLAVLIYFRKSISELVKALFRKEMIAERRIVLYLIIGTIPAAIIGVFFKEFFERAFDNPFTTSIELIITGLILLSTRLVRKGDKGITSGSSFLIGCGQAVAILPGISRSGTTISTALVLGVKPAEAAEFSFLLAIPALAGAAVLEIRELLNVDVSLIAPYSAGFFVSFVFSLASVYAVLSVIRRGRFDYFAYYCFAAGLVGLYLFR